MTVTAVASTQKLCRSITEPLRSALQEHKKTDCKPGGGQATAKESESLHLPPRGSFEYFWHLDRCKVQPATQ